MMLVTPTSSAHWYTPDGKPCHKVEAKSGSMRPTTLRDAKQLRLLPSVTTVLSMLSKPGLEAWKLTSAIEAALTLPRMENEPVDAFAKRVVADMDAHRDKAADFGTKIHAAIESGEIPDDIQPFVHGAIDWLDENMLEIHLREVVLVNLTDGYAGTVDMVGIHRKYGPVVVDFKTQGIKDGKPRIEDTWAWQLAAYREALLLGHVGDLFRGPYSCINLVINRNEPSPVVEHLWKVDDVDKGWQAFNLANRLWRLVKNYNPTELINERNQVST